MTTTAAPRKAYRHSIDRAPFSPLTGVGMVDALAEAEAEWRHLASVYPFDCFPLDTMSERLREHNAAHPDLWAASVRCSRLGDAIARRIDGR